MCQYSLLSVAFSKSECLSGIFLVVSIILRIYRKCCDGKSHKVLTKDQSFPLKATNPVISQDNHSGSENTTAVSGTDKEDIGNLLLYI